MGGERTRPLDLQRMPPIEQVLPERLFVVCQNTCSVVNPSTDEIEQTLHERVFDPLDEQVYVGRMATRDDKLTGRQRGILEVIEQNMRDKGYPPSVREIGEAVGLTSPSTVHSHLASLQNMGYLKRDPTKPRAIEVRWDPSSDAVMDRRPTRHVPLVGDVAAGTDVLAQENVQEIYPLPEDFTGTGGELFMLKVRGDSMIDAGILDGDYVVARAQVTAENGEIVIAGIPGDEATVKTYRRKGATITLLPSNPRLEPMVYDANEVQIFGKVVTVMRRL